MTALIDLDALLAPLAPDLPCGDNLRYAQVYDDIKEARRADDTLDRGEWQIDLKTSDWDEVIRLSVAALSTQTKDIQIAAWLSEALLYKYSFAGLAQGLELITALLEQFWECVYPEIDEDGDLDYRIAPLEFLLDRMAFAIKEQPLTDPGTGQGYSYYKWQESRQVGSEADTLDQYGEVNYEKRNKRLALIEEGKITAEAFDAAVAQSSREYYENSSHDLTALMEAMNTFEAAVDPRFGLEGPAFGPARESLAEVSRLIAKLLESKPAAISNELSVSTQEAETVPSADQPVPGTGSGETVFAPMTVGSLSDTGQDEQAHWEAAIAALAGSGIKPALDQLYKASTMSPSIRQKNRYRLLMGKLCLRANRVDLARPILEGLYALIEDLQLEKWESATWIGEVIETLYQCLTTGDESRRDPDRARDLLLKLCTTDVTKAITYQNSY